MVSALKEGAASSLMAISEVRTKVPEGAYAVDVEGTSLDEPIATGYAPAAASTSSAILPLSRYVHDT